MRSRSFLALLLLVAGMLSCIACARQKEKPTDFAALRDEYFKGFLRLNPTTSTYLGGDAVSPELAATLRRLKDYSEVGRSAEAAFCRSIQERLARVDRAALSPEDAVDFRVMEAQLRFLLHQIQDRKYYQRALDTYVWEPFRAVDWQIQQMTDLGNGHYGTEQEWMSLAERVGEIPDYLDTALNNLREGASAGNFPDPRMVETDGIRGAAGNAEYFKEKLPDQMQEYLSGQPYREKVSSALIDNSLAAGAAYEQLAGSLSEIFLEGGKQERVFRDAYRTDRYVLGEREYDWALSNNLRIDRKASDLFDYGARKVEETRQLMAETAKQIAGKRSLKLSWADPASAGESVRRVMDLLSQDYPKSDEEMFRAFREKAMALVAYAREKGMFDLPAEYRLDILETPAILRESVEASYYPAPPFKRSGIGRFYLTPTGGDVGRLKENNFHTIADLCAHEGFPGHDWNYQFLRSRSRAVSSIRWLTPGAVEDSSSMWEDSPASEGWALYAEALMGEPQSGSPEGFYTPEERLYQLQGQLLRDARVHLDTGLHTGRLTFEQAVDYYTEKVDFLPGACRGAGGSDLRRASCDTAKRAIYRYSKWPTQAVTYHLGKAAILDLREKYRKLRGEKYSAKEFHEKVLSQGTIPPGYFEALLLLDKGN